MDMQKARDFFEVGAIVSFGAVRNPMGKGWLLSVKGKGMNDTWTLMTALGKPKVFSSLDTLVGQVEQITGKEVYSSWLTLAM